MDMSEEEWEQATRCCAADCAEIAAYRALLEGNVDDERVFETRGIVSRANVAEAWQMGLMPHDTQAMWRWDSKLTPLVEGRRIVYPPHLSPEQAGTRFAATIRGDIAESTHFAAVCEYGDDGYAFRWACADPLLDFLSSDLQIVRRPGGQWFVEVVYGIQFDGIEGLAQRGLLEHVVFFDHESRARDFAMACIRSVYDTLRATGERYRCPRPPWLLGNAHT